MDAAGCFYQSWGSAQTTNERWFAVVHPVVYFGLYQLVVPWMMWRLERESEPGQDAVGIRDEQSEAPIQEVLHHVYRVQGSWPRRLAYV